MLDTGNHTDRACLTIWNCFFEVCAATTFRPMIHLKLLSKLVIPLSLGVELFGASWNVQLLKRSKGHSKETKMQKKTILPHTCLPLALCACSCSANWNLLRVDFNSTLAGKLRTREHSHNVMQTRFFFFPELREWNANWWVEDEIIKRIDRSFLPKQGQSENLLHRSEKRCKFGPTGGMEWVQKCNTGSVLWYWVQKPNAADSVISLSYTV